MTASTSPAASKPHDTTLLSFTCVLAPSRACGTLPHCYPRPGSSKPPLRSTWRCAATLGSPKATSWRTKMAEIPTLFVCHGDDGGPRVHPCRRVQEALRAADIEYEKVIAAHGSPIPFLRKGSRDELREATGSTKLPALKLPDGTVITHSRAILSWIDRQK